MEGAEIGYLGSNAVQVIMGQCAILAHNALAAGAVSGGVLLHQIAHIILPNAADVPSAEVAAVISHMDLIAMDLMVVLAIIARPMGSAIILRENASIIAWL